VEGPGDPRAGPAVGRAGACARRRSGAGVGADLEAFRYSEKLVAPHARPRPARRPRPRPLVAATRGRGAVLRRRRRAGAHLRGACILSVSRLSPEVAAMAEGRVIRGALHVAVAAGSLGGWLLVRDRLGASRDGVVLACLVWIGWWPASPAALHPGDPLARLRSPGPSLDRAAPGPADVTPYALRAADPRAGQRLDRGRGREHGPRVTPPLTSGRGWTT